MGRVIGIIAILLVVVFSLLFILHLWGLVHISIFTYLKSVTTLLIIGGSAVMVFVFWAMFLWKGNEGPKPDERPQKSKY
jgi:predicted RND superfamily exporter protein